MHFSKNLTLDLAMVFFVPFLNIRSGNVLLLSSLTCASGYVLLSYALSLDLDMFYVLLYPSFKDEPIIRFASNWK